jgi:hypothetical protein
MLLSLPFFFLRNLETDALAPVQFILQGRERQIALVFLSLQVDYRKEHPNVKSLIG